MSIIAKLKCGNSGEKRMLLLQISIVLSSSKGYITTVCACSIKGSADTH